MSNQPGARDPRFLPYVPPPDKDAGPRSLDAILEDLSRPIHPSYLGTMEKKNKKTQSSTEITFITWHTAVRVLNKYAPGWQYDTHSTLSLDGQHVVIDARIGIPTSDYGIVWRGASGSDEDSDTAWGDASDRAESQALRRAASKFGLALYLYYEKGAGGPTQRNPKPLPATEDEPPAPTEQAPQRTEKPPAAAGVQSPANAPAPASAPRVVASATRGPRVVIGSAAIEAELVGQEINRIRDSFSWTNAELLKVARAHVNPDLPKLRDATPEECQALLTVLKEKNLGALPEYASIVARPVGAI